MPSSYKSDNRSMWRRLQRFYEIAQESGLKMALGKLLVYFGAPNAIFFRDYRLRTACDIYTQVPISTQLGHPVGIVIAGSADIGENVQINQNVTIGEKDGGVPTICDNAKILSGAVVIGDIRVGENAVVGANAVVLDDVPDGATAVGVPATVIEG